MTKKKRTFEDDLKRLEELVRSLEQNELSLDESLAAFEEGSKLRDVFGCGFRFGEFPARVDEVPDGVGYRP